MNNINITISKFQVSYTKFTELPRIKDKRKVLSASLFVPISHNPKYM